MPSRPMFTTPARSEKSPPSAARPIGTASSRAAAKVDDDLRACWPEMTRTAETRTSTPANDDAEGGDGSEPTDKQRAQSSVAPPAGEQLGEGTPAGPGGVRSCGQG